MVLLPEESQKKVKRLKECVCYLLYNILKWNSKLPKILVVKQVIRLKMYAST